MLQINFETETSCNEFLVIGVFNNKKLSNDAQKVDDANDGILSKILSTNSNFNGEFCSCFTIFNPFDGCRGILVIGLGDKEEYKQMCCAELGAIIYKNCCNLTQNLTILIDDDIYQNIDAYIAFGMQIRSFEFNHYKTQKKNHNKLQNVYLKTDNINENKVLFNELYNLATGVNLARSVILEPGNVINPETLSNIAQKELLPLGVDVDVLDVYQLQELKMGGILAVGQGSEVPPRMVVMNWCNNSSGEISDNKKSAEGCDSDNVEEDAIQTVKETDVAAEATDVASEATDTTADMQINDTAVAKKNLTIAIVGKGVTFDSGGLNIKPDKSMQGMQYDMSGAGAVLGLMKSIALNKLPVNVVGVMGLAENMPSGCASRPGDIITTMSGKTVEILNTDAEGRVVLSDALWYVQEKYQPDIVIDLATLTGAIQIALGTEYAGLFSNDETLIDQIYQASDATCEKVWKMPLCATFDKAIDSKYADVCNISKPGTGAGSSTAAHFLKRFIKNGVKWAHLDIAGVTDENRNHKLTGSGAPGYGVRLMYELIKILN